MSNSFSQLHSLTLVQLPTALGQSTSANSLTVTIASDQTAIPITGSITATNASVGTVGATAPTSASAAGGKDGSGNLQILKVSAAGVLSVDGSAVTQPVSVASLPLPTGASTEATLSALSAKHPATLGQKTMAASMAVVIASDQTVIPASQSGTWNVTNVSGTVSLPTGAATETTLAAASAKLPATLGQKTMAAALAVSLASDQSAIPASQSGTWTVQPGNTANTTAWLIDQSVAASTFQAEGSLAGTALTGTYATAFTTGGLMKVIQIRSSCNQPIVVSLDGGSTASYVLEQGDSVSIDLKGNGLRIAAAVAIQAKHNGVTPTAGTVRINGVY